MRNVKPSSPERRLDVAGRGADRLWRSGEEVEIACCSIHQTLSDQRAPAGEREATRSGDSADRLRHLELERG